MGSTFAYEQYFGLREHPFSITPDPRFVYLSDIHRTALEHLEQGATGGVNGFVLLTGDVGTGKTTICRTFLEQLPPKTEVALILNPVLTLNEFLQAICDELDLVIEGSRESNKNLIDHLNRFLLQVYAVGQKTILIVDEAQNLSQELLEQIRLLTNLETATDKLLQIFLIGQPELRDMLNRPEMVQVSQRITSRYHLGPLNQGDTERYILRRLQVAGAPDLEFTPSALRRIHAFSKGVPRVINVLCDKVLAAAYDLDTEKITSKVVKDAEGRVLGNLPSPASDERRGIASTVVGLSLAGVLVVLVAVFFADLGGWRTWAVEQITGGPPEGPVVAEQAAQPPRTPPIEQPGGATGDPGVGRAIDRPAGAPRPAEPSVASMAALPEPRESGANETALPVTPEATTDTLSEPPTPIAAQPAETAAAPADPPMPEVQPPVVDVEPRPTAGVNETDTAATSPVSVSPAEPTEDADIPVVTTPVPAPPPAAEPPPPVADVTRREPAVAAATAPRPAPAPRSGPSTRAAEQSLTDYTRSYAERKLLSMWGIGETQSVGLDFCKTAEGYGMRCMNEGSGLNGLFLYDRPAIIFLTIDNVSSYAVVLKAGADSVVLDVLDQEHVISADSLSQVWDGNFLLLWKPPQNVSPLLQEGGSGPSAVWLRRAIDRIEGVQTSGAVFDASLATRVRRFQRTVGLAPDGIVGPRTFILLQNRLAEARG